MLWIGIAIAAAFVGLLVVRALADAGEGGGEAPAAIPPAAPPASTPPKERDKERDDDEPEGTRVASIPPPASTARKEMSVIAPLPEVGIDLLVEDDTTGPQALILVTAVGRTDPGRRRKHNEDAYLVLQEKGVFAIADGMGGYAAGEVASQLAVDVLQAAFETDTFTGSPDPSTPRRGDELVRAITMANTAVLTQARAIEAQSGMGTTIVACRFSPNKQRVYFAHVGDSRCYRIRGDELRLLTQDHTLGAVGITGPSASKLSRAVGIQESVDVDLGVDAPHVGDYYLLCSDGLSKMVPEAMIHDLVRESPNLEAAVERLVGTANERGGRDNVTVILIHVQEPIL
jgi:serine/threonine protein phosphatase PrpC